MKTVALLMTVHHRKEKTLSFIEECYRQIDALSSGEKWSFSFFLNDDGSADGLSTDVAEKYPQVRLFRTEGDKFWCGGLRTVWEAAAKEDFDFYIWLDYDLDLRENALASLLDNSAFLADKAIIVGSVDNPDGKLIYGGRTRSGKLIEPDAVIPIPCVILDGNLTLIPKYVFKTLGYIDERYKQYLWDYDYGVRAFKAGVTRVIAPGILAGCSRKRDVPIWRNPDYSLAQRYMELLSPKGRPFKQEFLYDVRSSGLLMAVWHFLQTNLMILFPKRRRI